MAVGYVLVNVSPGNERNAFESISGVESVKDVTMLFGDYDIIAKLEADNLGDIAKTARRHRYQNSCWSRVLTARKRITAVFLLAETPYCGKYGPQYNDYRRKYYNPDLTVCAPR